jgi:hypothetical protein
MKPFKPRTVEQQRANYIKACKQRLKREVDELKEIYFQEHERHAKLYHDKCDIERTMEKVQAKVADDADKEFGGWDTWRHDEKLLKIVVKRMDDAVVGHKARIDEINSKMERCLEKYRAEVKELTDKYYTLIKTA